jgi:hypothetical protein
MGLFLFRRGHPIGTRRVLRLFFLCGTSTRLFRA